MIAPTSLPTATVSSARGHEFQARPIHPDDKPMLIGAFQRLSERTRFNRFLAPADRLSSAQLAYLTELDFRDHVAWGLLDDGDPVAVARFIRLPEDPASADFAVTVMDEYQGRGVGPLMIQILAVAARARGVTKLHFDVLAENTPMLKVLARMGADVVDETGDVVHATLAVKSIPAPDVRSGDLGALLEAARSEAGGHSSASRSSDAEFTQ